MSPLWESGYKLPNPFDVAATFFSSTENGGWWDSSDLTTLFQNSNGTTAVSAPNDPIGYWGDKSGNGNHLIQATAGQRPLWTTFGSKSDGSNDFLRRILTTNITGVDMYCFGAVRIETIIADGERYLSLAEAALQDYGSTGGLVAWYYSQADLAMGSFRNSAQYSIKAVSAATKYLFESKWDGVDNINYVNGNSGTTVANTSAFDIDQVVIHGKADQSEANFSNSSIAELIIIDRVATAPEITDCRAYLTAKWGL